MQDQPPYANVGGRAPLLAQQPSAPLLQQSILRRIIGGAPQYMAPILLAAVVFYTAFLNRKANESGCEELKRFTGPGMWGSFAGDVAYLVSEILGLRANSQELREAYALIKGVIVRDSELPLTLRALSHLSNISMVVTAVVTAILFVTSNPVEACVYFILMGFFTLGLSHYQRARWNSMVNEARSTQSVFANSGQQPGHQPGHQPGQRSGFA